MSFVNVVFFLQIFLQITSEGVRDMVAEQLRNAATE